MFLRTPEDPKATITTAQAFRHLLVLQVKLSADLATTTRDS